MTIAPDNVTQLLRKWSEGDDSALAEMSQHGSNIVVERGVDVCESLFGWRLRWLLQMIVFERP